VIHGSGDGTAASRLGIKHSLIQAPLAGSTPPALVAAVSNAGALGAPGAGYLESSAVRWRIERCTPTPSAFDLRLRRGSYTAAALFCAAILHRGPSS